MLSAAGRPACYFSLRTVDEALKRMGCVQENCASGGTVPRIYNPIKLQQIIKSPKIVNIVNTM